MSPTAGSTSLGSAVSMMNTGWRRRWRNAVSTAAALTTARPSPTAVTTISAPASPAQPADAGQADQAAGRNGIELVALNDSPDPFSPAVAGTTALGADFRVPASGAEILAALRAFSSLVLWAQAQRDGWQHGALVSLDVLAKVEAIEARLRALAGS